ncbi:extracellular solute-binding protein [Rhodococcus hoagii]|nr:extracellular solute-binding protein [Prescottella equi]NKZ86930.1 extracellular solute-binding protein [Prescottella equi]
MRVKTWRVLVATGTCVALGAALSACGGGSGDSDTVTLKFLNYGDWVGETEIADFEAANPGIEIEQFALPDGGSSALAAQLAKDKGVYDLVAVGNATAARLEAGNLLADFDPASVPNLANLPQEYRDEFPWGIPTDLGKVGIIYDKEKVPNPPASWKELFDNASQWTGKIVLPDYDLDVQAIALLALGYDINTTDSGELDEAEAKIKEIKPHLLAFQRTGQAKSVADGSALVAVGYDYAFAGADDPSLGLWSRRRRHAGLHRGRRAAARQQALRGSVEVPRLPPRTGNLRRVHQQHRCLLPDAVAEQFIEPRILDNPHSARTRGRSSWSRSSCRPRTPRRAPRCGTGSRPPDDPGTTSGSSRRPATPGGGAHTRERRRGPAPPALVRNPARGADDGVCRGLLHRPARAPRGVQRHEVRPAHLPGALRLHPRELPRTLQRHLRRCGVAFARNDPRHDSGVRGARIPGRAHHRPCQRQDEGSAPGRGHRAVLDQFRRAHLRLAGTAVADRCRLQGRRVLRDRSGGCPTRLLHLRDRGRHGRGLPAPDDPADVHGTGPDRPGSARSCRRHGVEQAPSVLEGHGQLAMPGSIAGVLLVGIPATGEYTIPAILGGSKTLMSAMSRPSNSSPPATTRSAPPSQRR